jgi:hypothetical protein
MSVLERIVKRSFNKIDRDTYPCSQGLIFIAVMPNDDLFARWPLWRGPVLFRKPTLLAIKPKVVQSANQFIADSSQIDNFDGSIRHQVLT